jgi:SAM-dependent methyltransferase
MSIKNKLASGIAGLVTLGLPRGKHLSRYAMYQRLGEVGARLPNRRGDVLSISHSTRLCDVLGLEPSSVTEANYPEYNFLSLPFPDESFDFIISDQVLEHVEGNPKQAFDESLRVLRPNGIAVHTTCFFHPIHDAPGDYWRCTPEGLKLLARDFSQVIEYGGWGNFEAWVLARSGFRFVGIPHAKWHPLHWIATRNDPEWPISTWVVAQK